MYYAHLMFYFNCAYKFKRINDVITLKVQDNLIFKSIKYLNTIILEREKFTMTLKKKINKTIGYGFQIVYMKQI